MEELSRMLEDPKVRQRVEDGDRVPVELEANRERRAKAEAELEAAREELRDFLVRGQAAALDVAAMARSAGISRETAHRLLRKAGSVSWRQRHREAQKGKPKKERKSSRRFVEL